MVDEWAGFWDPVPGAMHIREVLVRHHWSPPSKCTSYSPNLGLVIYGLSYYSIESWLICSSREASSSSLVLKSLIEEWIFTPGCPTLTTAPTGSCISGSRTFSSSTSRSSWYGRCTLISLLHYSAFWGGPLINFTRCATGHASWARLVAT